MEHCRIKAFIRKGQGWSYVRLWKAVHSCFLEQDSGESLTLLSARYNHVSLVLRVETRVSHMLGNHSTPNYFSTLKRWTPVYVHFDSCLLFCPWPCLSTHQSGLLNWKRQHWSLWGSWKESTSWADVWDQLNVVGTDRLLSVQCSLWGKWLLTVQMWNVPLGLSI